MNPIKDMPVVYLCATRVSVCCEATVVRVCYPGTQPDDYTCQKCKDFCEVKPAG